jgi:hypothetical protein
MTINDCSRIGNLAFGYQVEAGYPVLTQNPDGATAVMKYIGPAFYATSFITEIFGIWQYEDCTVHCAAEPKPLALFCPTDLCGGTSTLYPEDFTIQPLQNCCTTVSTACGVPHLMTAPLVGEGFVEITVNYRHKNFANWPIWMRSECLPDDCAPILPAIANCTFIEVETENELDVQTLPGRSFEYIVDGQVLTDEDINPAIAINTTTYRVRWSNLPYVPHDTIRNAVGHVNSEPMFDNLPCESVLLADAEITERPTWYCTPTYDVEFIFVVKTVPKCPFETLAAGCACSGVVGAWNRAWRRNPLGEGSENPIGTCTLPDTSTAQMTEQACIDAGGTWEPNTSCEIGCHFLEIQSVECEQKPYPSTSFANLLSLDFATVPLGTATVTFCGISQVFPNVSEERSDQIPGSSWVVNP